MRLRNIRAWAVEHTVLVVGVSGSVALFLVIAGFLVVTYLGEISRQAEIQERIDRFGDITRGAQSRAEEVQAEFQAIQEGFPSAELSETYVFRTMLELVSESGLTISKDLELTNEDARKKVGKTDYRVLSFSMGVSGDPESVWTLVQALDMGETPFSTLVLGEVSLNLGGGSSASMEFDIFTLPR